MCKKVLSLSCFLLGIAFFNSNSADALTLRRERKEKLVVEHPFYQATILPNMGGRISSLILKDTNRNLTEQPQSPGFGFAKDIDVGGMYPGMLGVTYHCEVIEQTSEKIIIQLTCPTKLFPEVVLRKTYTFSLNTKVIKVELKVVNNGPPCRWGDRIHNMVVVGEKLDSDDIFFVPTTSGMKKLSPSPGTYRVKNFTQGWIGVMDKTTKEGIIFKADYDEISQFMFWMDKQKATIEWYYNKVAMETGDIWQTIYYIIPISNFTSIPYYVDEEKIIYGSFTNSNLLLNLKRLSWGSSKKMIIGGETLTEDNKIFSKLSSKRIVIGKDTVTEVDFPFQKRTSGIRIILQEEERKNTFTIHLKNNFVAKRAKQSAPSVITHTKEDTRHGTSLEKESEKIKILLIAYHSRFMPYQLYRIEEALEDFPIDCQIDFCECNLTFLPSPYECETLAENFPISVRGLEKYNFIIFVDTPAWVFTEGDEENLKEYVKRGGNLIFVGDQGRGYEGTTLSDLIPLQIDYTKAAKGSMGRFVMDKSKAGQVEFLKTNHSILQGLPTNDLPDIAVHKTKAKKEAIVLAAMNDYPVLALRDYGKGHIVSFPISLSETTNPNSSVSEDIKSSFRYLDDKLVRWDFYDELWGQMVLWGVSKESPEFFASFCSPSFKTVIDIPSSIGLNYEIGNRSKDVASGTVQFSLFKNKQKIEEMAREYFLLPGKTKKFAHSLNLSGVQGKYTYTIKVRDKRNKIITLRDGVFTALPKPSLEVVMENDYTSVFGRNSTVDIKTKIAHLSMDRKLSLKVSLIDFQGKKVEELPLAEILGAAEIISQMLPLGNLSEGEYTVKLKLLEKNRIIDSVEKSLYIVPSIQGNYFPILVYDTTATTPKKIQEKVNLMKSINLNGVSFYGGGTETTYGAWAARQEFDELQKKGMTFIPIATQLGHVSGFNKHGLGSSSFPKKAIVGILRSFHQVYGKSPKLLAYAVADEPQLVNITNEEKKAFKKKFGYDLPTDVKDKNYYYGYHFRLKHMTEGLKRQTTILKEFNPRFKQYAVVNPRGLVGNLDNVGACTTLDFVSMDWYHLGTRGCPFLDILWSATNFQDNFWSTPTTSLNFGPAPFYPEYMGHQAWLALGHGAKGVCFWVWSGHFSDFYRQPQRLACAKKAFGEIREIGPLFKRLRRERAKVAMLHTTTTFLLEDITTNNRRVSVAATHTLLEKIFGSVDVLHESQVERGDFISDYKVLFINESTYIPDKVIERIESWVKKGGILIATAKTGLYNQEQEKTDIPSRLFSAQYGVEVCLPIKELGILPVRGYRLLPNRAKKIHSYQDGTAAITSYSYGKGKAILVGVRLDTSSEILSVLTKGTDTLVCSIDIPDVCAHLFRDEKGKGYYLVTVNHQRETKNTDILINLPDRQYHIYDLLTGDKLNYFYKDNRLHVPIEVKPLWGMAIVILAQEPGKLSLRIKKECSPGDDLIYKVILSGKEKKMIDGSLPVEIKVIDALGRVRDEYGGIRVLTDGQFSGNFKLADNDPEGRWRIEVKERISGNSIEESFNMN